MKLILTILVFIILSSCCIYKDITSHSEPDFTIPFYLEVVYTNDSTLIQKF
jgi:hypothetical protein